MSDRIDSLWQGTSRRMRTRQFGNLPVLVSGFKHEGKQSPSRHTPLSILTVDQSGKASVDSKAILTEREATLDIDVSKTFKLNANTIGICG
jgi:hypothetical protein